MEKEAHAAGQTTIVYDVRSEQIVTSGADGKVTVWDSLDDEEPLQTFKISGDVHSLAIREDKFYTVNERGNGLVSYSLSDGQSDGLVTRFTASITDITSSKAHVAAGSSDFNIRSVNSKGDVCVLSGHEAPVLSVSLAPDTPHLVSASCDGTVRLWSLNTKACLMTYSVLNKYSDVSLSPSLCKTSWKSDGSCFAVPVEREVHIFTKNKEEALYILKDESITKPINVCSYNEDGSLLSAATSDGVIVVWSGVDQTKMYSHCTDSKSSITSLSWISKNKILYATNQGCFGSIDVPTSTDTVSDSKQSKLTSEEIADMFDGSDADDGDFMDAEAADDGDYKDLIEEHEDEVKVATRKARKSNAIDDDSDDDGGGADGDDIDDLGSEMTGSIATTAADKTADDKPRPDVTKTSPGGAALTKGSALLHTEEQEAFQPGSTPANQRARYMVWNAVGVIRCYSSEDDNTIDIEFHDTSKHHTIHINNTDNYTMADMGDQCALLATQDSGNGKSSLKCINFGGGDDQQQWSATLDNKHEDITCVCVGGDYLAVATSSHMIRGFSSAGFQLAPFLIPGAPVAMCGYNNVLFVVYHTAPAMNGYQHLSMSMLTMTGKREVLTHCSKLPLSQNTTLQWIGFTAEGTPVMYDSNGILSFYRINGHDMWTPVLNTKSKDKHSTQFIVSIVEVPAQVRAVTCRGGSKYPSTSVRPTVGILDLRIPLCGIEAETGAQEETVWRHKLLSQSSENWLCNRSLDTSSYDKQEQTSLIKLFSTACREERLDRAYQISELMTESYLKIAAQYANRTHNVDLAQKVLQLVQSKRYRDEDEQESVFGLVAQPVNSFAAVSRLSAHEDTTEQEEDDLTRFTAARFSTGTSKDVTASLLSQKSSQHSPSADLGSVTSQPLRTSFTNALSSIEEPSQDSQSSRQNPFKRKSVSTSKPTSIEHLHKMIDDASTQKQEQKKLSNLPLQPPKVKQTKLFSKEKIQKPPTQKDSEVKPSDVKPSSESTNKQPVSDENTDKPPAKVTAFDLFYKEKCEGQTRSEAFTAFKSLPKNIKKAYCDQADDENNKESENNSVSMTADKKRKLDSSDDANENADIQSSKKQTLIASENTKSKLAAFANN